VFWARRLQLNAGCVPELGGIAASFPLGEAHLGAACSDPIREFQKLDTIARPPERRCKPFLAIIKELDGIGSRLTDSTVKSSIVPAVRLSQAYNSVAD